MNEPRHGTRDPTSSTPLRRPGSLRRTTTVDAVFPDGLGGRMVLEGRGWDLSTGPDGPPSVLATASLAVDVEFDDGPRVRRVAGDPPVDAAALIGRVASSGFRAVIDSETDAVPGTLAYLMLDDVPAATLVSGYAGMRAVERGDLGDRQLSARRPPGPALQFPDLCAGFRSGGMLVTEMERHGGHTPSAPGPSAPAVERPDDPWSWHEMPSMPPDSMRRRRRVDLGPSVGGIVDVDVFFRDSHMDPRGHETIVHEYALSATVDALRGTILRAGATPRVLPWRECPEAAASAGRLAGMSLAGLRANVRSSFVGPTTCTHLNDTMRGLQDVGYLVALLP